MSSFVIGDIHGCFLTFKALLEKINFKKEDRLYLLGDYVDRGPSSKEVLDYLIYLKKENYNIFPIIGNHDYLMLKSIKNFESYLAWLKSGANFTLKSFNVELPTSINQKYFDFLKNLFYYIKLEKYFLVHGGINQNIENPLDDLETMLWERNTEGIHHKSLKNHIVICGHTPKKHNEVLESLDTNRIFLDGGCCYSKKNIGLGNLYALQLENKELYWQINLD